VTEVFTNPCISPPDVLETAVVPGLMPEGQHDAKLVGIRNARGRPGEKTRRFVFRITSGECKNKICSYFVAFNGRDQNFHLKLVLYFLGYGFRSTEDIDFEDLIGRRCKIKIEHKERNGRVLAQIVGFEFADDQPWG
jgi:hypothetical protein